jgi:hypothetical protein
VKYELIIENNIKQTSLKRVRIKVDPSLVCQTEDLSQCDGYEGFILAETGDVPKVLVMSPDGVSSVMDIPQQFLQVLMSSEESEALKAFKEYICDICELDTTTPEASILLNAETVEEVESLLKQTGLTDDELRVLYRNFIADSGDIVNESMFKDLLNKAASATWKTVKSPAAWMKGVGNVINTIDPGNKIGAAATGVGNKLDQAYKKYERYKKDYKFNQEHLPEYKKYAVARYPRAAAIIDKGTSIDDINIRLKKALNLSDIQVNTLYVNFFRGKESIESKVKSAKPSIGDVTTFKGINYVADGAGWGTPSKKDATKVGVYAPKALQPLITASWRASTP